MLEELLKGVDEKELQVFTRKFGISKMSNKEIADKNAIVTPKTGVAFSRSIASLHTAFNVIAATTKNRNNIEKAKFDRLDTSTKEDYMEARLPLPPQLDAISDTNVDLIGGVASAISDFSRLLDDLGDALSRLDLSCNVCIEPCEPDIDRPRVRPIPTPLPQRERVRTPVAITQRERVRVPVAIAERVPTVIEGTYKVVTPAPPRLITAPVTTPRQLTYQPLPEAPSFQVAPKELVRAAPPPPVLPEAYYETGAAAREVPGGRYYGKSGAEIRAMRQAERVSAAKPTGGQARIVQPAPPRPRWTSTVPREQYFEALRANRAQASFEQAARAKGPIPKAPPSLALRTPTVSAAAAKPPSAFNRVVTNIAQSRATRIGGRVLGVVGTGADIYARQKAGQSIQQTAMGVGGGLAGAFVGGQAGAAAGGAIGAIFGGIGAVPGAFIGGIIGSGLGYFGGGLLGDIAYEKTRPTRKPATPSDRAIRKDAEKATRQLVTTTKKVQTQAQRVNAQDRRVAANTSSILDRFAGSLNNALRTMTMTAAAFPGLVGAGLTAGLTGSLGKFGRGFQQGIEGVTPATPNEAANQAMAFFMSQDWTKEQAAGIVGNLQVESSNFSPDVVLGRRRGDRGNAIGVAQWNVQYSPERVANFQRVMGRPLAGAGLQEQLQFIQWELNNTEKRAAAALRQTNDPGQAAAIIDAMYERSSGAHRAQRMANAMALASGGDTMVTQAGRFAGNIFGGVTNFLGDVGNLFTGTPGQLAFPVGRARVSSGYGMRTHPEYKTVKMHSGIDFAVPVGTPVVASESGKVTLAGSSRGYGWNIVVAHGGGLGTRYAHLARFLVGPGQTVQKGQVIALSGGARGMPGAGTSTGPHLHYEVLKNGQAINPASFLSGASLAAVSPERGNNATEEDAVRPTSKQPARGGYLADIVTGNAAARRRKQGPKVVVVQAPSRIQPPASLAARGAQRPGTGRGPTIDYSRLYFNK